MKSREKCDWDPRGDASATRLRLAGDDVRCEVVPSHPGQQIVVRLNDATSAAPNRLVLTDDAELVVHYGETVTLEAQRPTRWQRLKSWATRTRPALRWRVIKSRKEAG